MQFYNHTRKLLWNKEVDFAVLKAMLVGAGYAFGAAETVMSTAAAQQVSGNGWTAGGPTLASVAITVVDTNGAMIDAADVSVNASGGSIGPATGVVIYDSTGANAAAWKPLFYYEFAEAKTATVGQPFNLTFATTGIARDREPV
jgi:hypothetical protein